MSIAVNAALGIYAVLAPDFGDTQGKILGTSLCVTGAVLLALACEPAWERRLLGPVPPLGAVLGAVGFALADRRHLDGARERRSGERRWGRSSRWPSHVPSQASWRSRSSRRGMHGSSGVTLGLLGLGAAMISLLLWLGEDPADEYLRALGVVLIVLAAFTVTVPVLHWVDRAALAAAEAETGAVRFCPYCGREFAGDRRA